MKIEMKTYKDSIAEIRIKTENLDFTYDISEYDFMTESYRVPEIFIRELIDIAIACHHFNQLNYKADDIEILKNYVYKTDKEEDEDESIGNNIRE